VQLTWWTPHQYEAIRPYVDTVLLTTWQPQSLDIAVPHGAAQIIATAVEERLADLFHGRVGAVRLGAILWRGDVSEEVLADLVNLCEFQPRFTVLITDRTLLSGLSTRSIHGVQWLLCDWWRWFICRIPSTRQADAWMYLCAAANDYRQRPEVRALGLSEATLAGMAEEGERLLTVLVTEVANRIQNLWNGDDSGA
jgi:hypothetical protein